MHWALQCALANAVFSGEEHCGEEMSRRRTILPNVQCTVYIVHWQSRLILLSLILHPVSQASHAPNHQKSWFWLMTNVLQQNTDEIFFILGAEKMVKMSVTLQILKAKKSLPIKFNDWYAKKLEVYGAKLRKKDNGRQTEANQRRRPPGTEGAEIWANKSMMSSSNVEAPPKVWVSSYEDSNAS